MLTTLFKRFKAPVFSLENIDEIISKIEETGIGSDFNQFLSDDCKAEGIAFANSFKEQILEKHGTVPKQILAKHTNWLPSLEHIERTYNLVLIHFGISGKYDPIGERISITGYLNIY